MRRPAKSIVFVVDDDRDVRSSLKFVLQTAGFGVQTFSDARSLLASSRKDRADCFIIDYKMPRIDGLDLTRRLRASGARAPILIITGYPGDGLEELASAAGARRVLYKPHVEDELVREVSLAIANEASNPSLRESP